MKRLTQRQADHLRKTRRLYGAALAAVHEAGLAAAGLCEHEDAEPDCPGCHLEWLTAVAKAALEPAARDVDTFLEHGPVPRGYPSAS